MSLDMRMYNDFLAKWPIDRVRHMTLEEYSRTKKKSGGEIDTFTYWLEAKLQDYGSIWGGSSFKFGIYSRNDEEIKESKQGRRYNAEYAWYEKYGKAENEAFVRVRGLVVSVIEAVRKGDLAAIDGIDLGDVYKWKIAFHYQNDIERPVVLNIYDPVWLRSIAGLGKSAQISACHKKLIAGIGNKAVTDYAETLLNSYQKRNAAEISDSRENRMENINTIYYGPPGTGKTYKVLGILKHLTESAEVATDSTKLTWLDPSATYWHLAPGQGGYLWNTLKAGNRLGYEWCSYEYGDLKTANINNEHRSIIKRFSKVRKGDYFVVISGFQLLGIARSKQDYDYGNAITEDYDFQTVEVDWIARFDMPIILNSTQTMTFCNLKGGSRWESTVKELAVRGYVIGVKDDQVGPTLSERRARKNFIQGIKPVMGDDEEDPEDNALRYRIEPGIFLQACEYACQNAEYPSLRDALADSRNERKRRFADAPPFYLVIDEINRGNVANIFGELITLVESDKRLGNENETIVSLPYSKEPFGVPGNLFIIGTMNTADRSVEALDSALRRRFSFIATYPDSEAIVQPEQFDVDLKKLLDALNARIEQVLDLDHTIGHGYFTGIKDADDPLAALAEIFRRKIIPQLREYLYGAPEKLHRILGPAFVSKVPNVYHLFGDDDEPLETWTVNVPAAIAGDGREKAEKAFRLLYE